MEAVETLGSRAFEVARACDLGEPRMEYRDRKPLLWQATIMLLGVSLLFCLISIAYFIDFHQTLEMSGWWVGFVGAFFLGGLVCLSFLVRRWIRGEPRFYLCAGGLVIATTRSIKEVIRWQDIAGIQQRITRKNRGYHSQPLSMYDELVKQYVLVTKAGHGYTFGDNPGFLLDSGIADALLSAMLERFHSEQDIDFGYLTVNAAGIRLTPDSNVSIFQDARYLTGTNWLVRSNEKYLDRSRTLKGVAIETGERFVPWQNIRMAWIDNAGSALVISRSGENKHWAMVPLHKVPNAELCLKLIENVIYSDPNQEKHDTSIDHTSLVDAAQSVEVSSLVGNYRTRMRRSDKFNFAANVGLNLIYLSVILFFLYSQYMLLITILRPMFSGMFAVVGPLIFIGSWLVSLRNHQTLVTPLRRKIKVSLYEKGFVYHEGREKRVVPWSRIREIQRSLEPSQGNRKEMSYTIKLVDGPDIVLRPLIGDVDKLGEAVERGMAQYLWPRILARFQAGKPVTFPGLAITIHSLSDSQHKFLWRQIEVLELSQRYPVIKSKHFWGSWHLPLSLQIVNRGILVMLLLRIKESQGLDMRVEV